MNQERALTLTITTPLDCAVELDSVRSIRARDASGEFGILPGHADLLTVLDASVMRWRQADGDWHFCALRGGILRVTGGQRVEVACREAIPGDDLATLAALVTTRMAEQEDAARRARTEQTRLHANAIRSLMQRLGRDGSNELLMEIAQ